MQQNDERLQESIVIPYENTIGIVDPVSEELIHIDLLRQFQKQYFSNISVDFQQLQTYLKHLGIEKISLDGYSYNCFYMDTKIFRFTFKLYRTKNPVKVRTVCQNHQFQYRRYLSTKNQQIGIVWSLYHR